jgi:bilirubin oxidase
VIDFASFKGQSLTLLNDGSFQASQDYGETGKVLQFRVGKSVSNKANDGSIPSSLASLAMPPSHANVDRTFAFDFTGGRWLINGVGFENVKNRILARPKKGSIERWRFVNKNPTWPHAIHVHLVEFQVVNRFGPKNGVTSYESAGLKDVVALGPGETIDVVAKFLPWEGTYMFHCHNLIHEDDDMMDAFTVDALQKAAGKDVSSYEGIYSKSKC